MKEECQPLRNKYRWNMDNMWHTDEAELDESNSAFYFKDVASACRFYRRYAWELNGENADLIMDEQLEVWKLYGEYSEKKKKEIEYWTSTSPSWRFDSWLFDYCFGDVIEK